MIQPSPGVGRLIRDFTAAVGSGAVEIYNEFSLQHELGIHLRNHLPGHKVQFERNVSFFFPGRTDFEKREIDIAVFSEDGTRLITAIELKFPRSGQYPEQMFSFCKDIRFAEQLKQAGFPATYALLLADDHRFYRGAGKGIYGPFREGKPLTGIIRKPTGQKDKQVELSGSYTIQWEPLRDELRCTLVEAI